MKNKKSLIYLFLLFVTVAPVDLTAQWTQRNDLGGNNIHWLVASGGYLFAAVDTLVFYSIDGGMSWKPSHDGLPTYYITDLHVDSSNLYAGSDGGGVYKSNDLGAHWFPVNDGLTNLNVYTITQSGTDLFIGTQGGGVFRSQDDGLTWSPVNAGISNLYVNALATRGASLFAGTKGGLFRSTDDGATWQRTNRPLDSLSTFRLASDSTNIFALAGDTVYRSSDDGTTWFSINPWGGNGLYPWFIHVHDSRLFASDIIYGLFILDPDTYSWKSVNTGLVPSGTVVFLGSSGNTLFASTFEGNIYSSVNLGESWSDVYTNLRYTGVIHLNHIGSTLLAGTVHGFARSTNNGYGWRYINSDQLKKLVFTSIVRGTDLIVGTFGGGIFHSPDSGVTWTAMNNGITDTIIWSLAADESYLFAGATSLSGKGLWRSSDSGMSWESVNIGIGDTVGVTSITVHKSYIIARAYPAGMVRSSDEGVSWNPINNGLTGSKLTAVFSHRGILFAGTVWTGIYRSTNDGDSWERVGIGVTEPEIRAFASDSTNIFAVGTDTGYNAPVHVFLSTDEGEIWTNVNSGLPSWSGFTTVDVYKDTVFGGGAAGVWRRPISEMVTSVDDRFTALPEIFSLSQNFPNPFNPVTEIQYTIPERSNSAVTLKVFNLLGQEIATLVNEPQELGKHSVRWYAGSYPSGIYFYRLQVGNHRSTMKSVLIK